jgi:hypothetical protein
MKITVPLPEGFAARVPVDRANDLLRSYCEGVGRALPDGPGAGPDVIEVELWDGLVSAIRKNQGLQPDEAVRRVLVASAKPEPRPAFSAQRARVNPAPKPMNAQNVSPILVVLFSILAPIALIVAAFIFARRFPASHGGTKFEEWTGGE